MKPHTKTPVSPAAFLLLAALSLHAAGLPADWQYQQRFDAAGPGIVKFSLPAETLNAARPNLEDLRLYDDAGKELPFYIDRPVPAVKAVQAAKSFSVSLNPNTTVVTLETGLTQPLDGVSLETPSGQFIKAVGVEGSQDGLVWRPIAQGQPVFREQHGASQLRVGFPAGPWRWLRLTLDDTRTQPIPFTGARVHAAAPESTPVELQTAAIVERNENPGETRLALNLGAANLDIASVQIETPDPLFTRLVTLAVPVVSEDAVREETLGEGCVYRVAIEGRPTAENLSVRLEARVRSREMLLLIRNQDSPPLSITRVRVERRPPFLVFMARASGAHHLLSGNSRCPAPRYDLASLGAGLKTVASTPVPVSLFGDNPNFRAPETLAGVELGGAALDVASWKFRKAILVSTAGVQQLDLDLDVLARAGPGFADLRLLRGSNQVPYLAHHTSIRRALTPPVTLTNDAKHPKLSRWIIKLPRAGLPLTRLSCQSRSPLFHRDMTLWEELTDDRGNPYRLARAAASWTQTPESKSPEFALALHERLQSDTLVLETENGDNPPIDLDKFTAFYPVSRVLFKAKPGERLFLYYGNPRAPSPRYDLSLVAGQLLAADKTPAGLGAEEQLKKPAWRDSPTPGKGGVMLWGILAVVVVALLALIARLLPKPAA